MTLAQWSDEPRRWPTNECVADQGDGLGIPITHARADLGLRRPAAKWLGRCSCLDMQRRSPMSEARKRVEDASARRRAVVAQQHAVTDTGNFDCLDGVVGGG